jgi:aminoglycoside phosphotransferase family enzyme/predicted kinase
VAETHISTVFFTADRAYKLLKPLETSFLDQSTPERRLRAIDDELVLNRRMAPDVYLGTADVVERGTVVDRMLVMRRLPPDRRLTDLIAAGHDVTDCVRSIARQVAVFHAAEEPASDGAEIAGRDAVLDLWRGNFGDLEALRGVVIDVEDYDRVHHLAERYLTHREDLFAARVAGGFVRDGHGDLTAQDMFCLDDGPRILDCLAFDRRLRVADVLADVGFLAMDLQRLAGEEVAEQLLADYAELTNEHHPPSLAHHYIAYRAHVRAKVAGIRHHQGDPAAAAEVRQYHDLCLRRLEQGRVRLIVVGGSPGTGKSTLSRSLADSLQALVLATDELRKDLAGMGHLERDLSPPDEGIYASDLTERTYTELMARAAKVLDAGRSVVLDASWNQALHRTKALALAEEKGADAVEVECRVDLPVARERLAARLADGRDPSDARPELLDELRRRQEAWPTAVAVDTGATPEEVAASALAAIARRDVHQRPR